MHTNTFQYYKVLFSADSSRETFTTTAYANIINNDSGKSLFRLIPGFCKMFVTGDSVFRKEAEHVKDFIARFVLDPEGHNLDGVSLASSVMDYTEVLTVLKRELYPTFFVVSDNGGFPVVRKTKADYLSGGRFPKDGEAFGRDKYFYSPKDALDYAMQLASDRAEAIANNLVIPAENPPKRTLDQKDADDFGDWADLLW